MPRPTVDVGVLTFNACDVSVPALRRLVETDHGVDIRVLVRDNASSDGTPEVIAAELPQVELDAGRQNLGFAAGMNTLIARSTAPGFFCLNPAAWPEPGAIAGLVATGEAHPEAAVVAPRIERPDGTLEHSTLPFPSLRVAAVMAARGPTWLPSRVSDRLFLEGHWHHDRPRDVDWAVGAAWLMRRQAIDAVGGFDEAFFMYAEDVEWCWRARRAGWTIRFEPGALIRHVGNASGRRVYGDRRTAAYLRNTYRFYRSAHGLPRTLAYRALNAAAAGSHAAVDRLAGRRQRAAWWSAQLRVHLSPVRGDDGPPGAGS